MFFLLLILSTSAQYAQYTFYLSFATVSNDNVNYGTASTQAKLNSLSPTGVQYEALALQERTHAVWISRVTAYANGSFSEVGNITFPNGATLVFESAGLGTGRTGPGPEDGYGTISYNITLGTGPFTGATGWMSDIFIGSGDDAGFDINALGVFWLPISTHKPSEGASYTPFKGIVNKWDEKHVRAEFAVVFDSYVVAGNCAGQAPSQDLISEVDNAVELFFILKNDTNSSQSLHWRSTTVSNLDGSFSMTGNVSLVDTGNVSLVEYGAVQFASNALGHSGKIVSVPFSGVTLDVTSGTGVWEGASGSLLATTVSLGGNHHNLFAWGVFWLPST